jgi:DNA-binding MarR family transcriptional regulator
MIDANKLGALGMLIGDATSGALGDTSESAAALLLTLRDRQGITITELARVAGIAQPTAVRVLDGIARRGWIERQERDGRTTPLRLTPSGRQQAKALQAARLAALERLLAPLPAAERRGFLRGLDRVLAAATVSRGFARTTCRLCDHETCAGALCPIGTRATELEQGGPSDKPKNQAKRRTR